MEGLNLFIKDIKSKKELKSLSDDFVKKISLIIFEEYPEKYNELIKGNWNKKSKNYSFLFKEIRKKLRIIYGAFDQKGKKNSALNSNNMQGLDENFSDYNDLLIKHKSTNERIDYYDEFYDLIKEDESVLDLGCGYNPFSYVKEKRYLASDVSVENKALFERHFKDAGIDGSYIYMDLTDEKYIEKLSSLSAGFDVTLMLKLVDTLESISRDITLKLLQKIQSKKIIISLPIMSLGGRKEIKSKRVWLDKFIEQENFQREDKIIGNESFIILKRI